MLNFLFWYVIVCLLGMLLFLAIFVMECKMVVKEHSNDFKEILGDDFDKKKEELDKVCTDYNTYLRTALWFLAPRG